nr:hypothetical protein GCM10020092_044870 [Actinoplanes digitatis]
MRRAGTTAYVIEIGQEWLSLDLAPGEHPGGAGDMRAGPPVRPRRRGQALADCHLHEPVPGGVELDLVDAVAVAVVGDQARLVPVGLLGPALRLGAAAELAEPVQVVGRPAGALAGDPFEQGGVGGDVVADQRRRLVDDVMGSGRHAHNLWPAA